MNYSYIMGIKDISILKNKGFIIEKIKDNFGVVFESGKEKEYEEFITNNLEEGYWNEYLGERLVFIFKYPDSIVKKYIYSKENEQEILELCCRFAEYKFSSIKDMLMGNEFYKKNYFDKKKCVYKYEK